MLALLGCLLFITGLLFRGIENRLAPVLLRYAIAEAENMAQRVAGNAVADAVRDEGVEYKDILVLYPREDGMVTACRTDTAAINRLQSAVLTRLERYFKGKEAVVSVPLGNISQNSFFYGRGPDVSFAVVPVGRVELQYGNDYEACGINQTRHSLYFTLNMTIRVSGSRGEEIVTCSGTFPVAETIIVGYVPESYVDVAWKQIE